MRSRPPRPSLRRGLAAAGAGALALVVVSACLPTGDPMTERSWGINGGGDVDGWHADTRDAPSSYLNVGEADLRTSVTSSPIDMSHPSVPEGTPAELYQTHRNVRPGAPMRWTLPLAEGEDRVRLHFAETRDRFLLPGATVTDVAVNGRVVIDDLDVFAEVGANKALVHEIPVSGSQVQIELRAEAGWPSIAAIEVLDSRDGEPAPTTQAPPVTQAPAPTTTQAPAPTTTQAPAPTTTTTKAPTTTTTAPAPAPVGDRLSFRPPALTNPTTLQVSNTNRAFRLDDTKDYILKMPSTPLDAKGGLNISGGRNVVVIGGHIHFSQWYGDSPGKNNRGMYLQNQTGTLHIEGVLVSGLIGEGIDLSQTKGAVVQLQNIRIESATGTKDSNHADVIQSWAGPRKLLIDRFTGYTGYQGFFLLPNQWFDGPAPELFDFRNVNLVGNPDGAGYLYWVDENRTRFPVRHQNLWAKPSIAKAGNPDQWLWPQPKTGDRTWEGVREGVPADGDIVKRGDAGLGYVSPGYAG